MPFSVYHSCQLKYDRPEVNGRVDGEEDGPAFAVMAESVRDGEANNSPNNVCTSLKTVFPINRTGDLMF